MKKSINQQLKELYVSKWGNFSNALIDIVEDENYNVKFHDWNAVKSGLRDELSRLMYERTKRRPMILPILMEI